MPRAFQKKKYEMDFKLYCRDRQHSIEFKDISIYISRFLRFVTSHVKNLDYSAGMRFVLYSL